MNQNNRRIAKNTLMLYFRMLLLMLISLYTSRVILDKLGITDFGIYNVVGGIVAMLGFLNAAMSNTVQRFLSFEFGKGNSQGVHRVFCISLQVHAVIALVVMLTMEIAGVWYVNTHLNIPPSRVSAANWVLQCTIVTTVFNIMQVPYNAIIISKEQMGIYAYISVLEAVLKLLIALLLGLIAVDKLKLYSVLVMVVTIVVLMIYQLYCTKKYKESRFQFIKDMPLLKEMTCFAGWNVTSELAWSLVGPGVNVILNAFFGPVVNAAMGVAQQVSDAVNRFIANFQTAVNPQIIKFYSSGKLDDMNQLVYRSTRFSFYLLLFISLPLILQMKYVMEIWLVKIPENADIFCQLILISSLTSVLSTTLPKVAWATGKIRNYQIIVSLVLISIFPLSYLVLKMGARPTSVIWVNISIQAILIFVRLRLTCRMIGSRMKPYLVQVILKCLTTAAIAIAIPLLVTRLSPTASFLQFCLSTALCCTCCALSCYYCGMSHNERASVKKMILKMRKPQE